MKYLEYLSIRQNSLKACESLTESEFSLQPANEVSPPKWHLGHTTWFFEKFILKIYADNYKVFNPEFDHIFNSYYKQSGTHWDQSERSKIPVSLTEVYAYRDYVDQAILNLIKSKPNQEILDFINTGLHHEEQHQELLYMDAKHIKTSLNIKTSECFDQKQSQNKWFQIEEQLLELGHNGEGFSYDNERPRHKTYIYPALINYDLVTVNEYKEFINAGGYSNPKYWLSKGWDWVQKNKITNPLYWNQQTDGDQPVAHVSYFEAYAYAHWSGCRLPTEFEHEIFDQQSGSQKELWAWTSSSYAPYPNFKEFDGALSEYNGKFMCNQYVLRGGCKYTPKNHWRPTYRNFYEPHQRWMFSGVRLAKGL